MEQPAAWRLVGLVTYDFAGFCGLVFDGVRCRLLFFADVKVRRAELCVGRSGVRSKRRALLRCALLCSEASTQRSKYVMQGGYNERS